jgi:hypothetical protein
MSYHYTTAQAVIADSATTSAVIDLEGYIVVGIGTDAAFDGAGVTYSGCATATGTFVLITGITSTIAASALVAVTGAFPTRFIKVISGATQSPASTVTLYLRSA